MSIIELANESGLVYYGMGKDRAKFIHHLEAFAALVEAATRADEREECLADVKKVFNTFESFPQSPEIKLIRSFTSIFFEAIDDAIRARGTT